MDQYVNILKKEAVVERYISQTKEGCVGVDIALPEMKQKRGEEKEKKSKMILRRYTCRPTDGEAKREREREKDRAIITTAVHPPSQLISELGYL